MLLDEMKDLPDKKFCEDKEDNIKKFNNISDLLK